LIFDGAGGFCPDDERVHAHDPAVWSWNESFLLSWLDRASGSAALFRLGLLPNQGRGWLWFFLLHEGDWLALEETRLDLRHFDLAEGVVHDAWGLRFGWTPTRPLEQGRFALEGVARIRNGDRAGALVPVAVDLTATATAPCFGTGTGGESEERPEYPASRFEQSVALEGELRIAGESRPLRCSGHRDRSWGPRTWQLAFTLGDLQGDGLQLWFAGTPQLAERGGGYLKDARGVHRLARIEGRIDYDDARRTIAPAALAFVTEDGERLEVELVPETRSFAFDMAHACDPPEHWTYWRTLVRARITGSGDELWGWLEANRYGHA